MYMYKIIDELLQRGEYKKAHKLVIKKLSSTKRIDNKVYLLKSAIFICLREHNVSLAKKYSDQIIVLADKTDDINYKSVIYHMYGLTLFKTGNLIDAHMNLKKALYLSRQAKNEELEVKVLDSIGKYYEDDGEVLNAIYYYKMSERKKIILKDNIGLAITYGNLGRVYFESGDIYKAKEYFQLDYTISKNLEDYFGQTIMLNQLGDVYRMLGHINYSEKSYQSALDIANKMDYELSRGFSILGLGYIATLHDEIEKAKEYAEKVRKIFKSFNKYDGKIDSLILLSNIAIRENDMEQAEKYLLKANNLAVNAKVNFEISKSLFETAKFYFMKNKIYDGLERVDRYFQVMMKLSKSEFSIFRNVLALGEELVGAEDALLILKRDRALEMIKISPGLRNRFKISRQVLTSWEELHERVVDKSEHSSSREISNWLRENKYISEKYIVAASLSREGDDFGYIVAMNNNPFLRSFDDTLNILNVYASKVAEVISTVLSIELSRYDALTRLKNRESLDKEIKDEVYKAIVFKKNFITLMIDIDDFKDINDVYGHQLGDFILVNISNILRSQTRETDLIFRYGGDEFLVVIGNVNRSSVEKFAERLLEKVRKQNIIYRLSGLKITISIGGYIFKGSEYSEDTESFSSKEIIKKADKSLYKAKYAGKDRFCLYGEGQEI
ncbi:hypothetical protein DRP43_00660 [candidate division TA06 bacterium]|uniref:GGDEF domain-containing protein n=1 Tax=candidate division TA06 bacterium TaxID=2250710 RepID=A0A660SNV8_UNCT6|nr:MAG: hypothetical protein DRP43_00660 [candidate division TA06 bacterium]